MNGFLTAFSNRLERLAWDAYQGGFRAMGLDRASAAGSALARRVGPLTGVHHVARVNMRFAFPQAGEAELDLYLDAMWDNLGRTLGEVANMDRINLTPGGDHLEVINLEALDAINDSGRAVVFVGGHFANWEMQPAFIGHYMANCGIAYRAVNNPLVEARIRAMRDRYGVNFFAPKGASGARVIMSELKSGASIAMLTDQKMNDGIAAPFLGRPAMTASAPARMALRYGLDVVPMSVRRLEGVRFQITVHDPIEPPSDRGGEGILELTTRINAFLEDQIRAAPPQWFWVHRRFEKALYRKSDTSSASSASGSI
ncbi:MAG: lysophospholipid acyltransferase family protein [Oceanicaulis sp.]|nr:lysophospholipid acyltransferase family protein [Oceanicaulis sp.]